jgi:hypothetical protein
MRQGAQTQLTELPRYWQTEIGKIRKSAARYRIELRDAHAETERLRAVVEARADA